MGRLGKNNNGINRPHILNKQRRLDAIHNATNPTNKTSPVMKSSLERSNGGGGVRSSGSIGWLKQKGRGGFFGRRNNNRSDRKFGPATLGQHAQRLQHQEQSRKRYNAQKGGGLLVVGLMVLLQHQYQQNPVEKQHDHHPFSILPNKTRMNQHHPPFRPLSSDIFGKAASSDQIDRVNSSKNSIPLNMRRVSLATTTWAGSALTTTTTTTFTNPPRTARALLLLVGDKFHGGAVQVANVTTRFVSRAAEALVGKGSRRMVRQVVRAASCAIVIVPVRVWNVTMSLAVSGSQALFPLLPNNSDISTAATAAIATNATIPSSPSNQYQHQDQPFVWIPKSWQGMIAATPSSPNTRDDLVLTDAPSHHSQPFILWKVAMEHSHRVLQTIGAGATLVKQPRTDSLNQRNDRFLTWVRRIHGASLTEHYYYHDSMKRVVAENTGASK